MHGKFYLQHGKFSEKLETYPLYSDFVCCVETFLESSLQLSSFRAFKILDGSSENCLKTFRQLTKACKASMQAQLVLE